MNDSIEEGKQRCLRKLVVEVGGKAKAVSHQFQKEKTVSKQGAFKVLMAIGIKQVLDMGRSYQFLNTVIGMKDQ